ncbi:hypothetical protein SAMN06297387_101424 [Streptomyces zhaozhouensis]|uniref:DUF732 domain-containing protein n=1 Tax=Streptomyces zhaozhouensis TaxID=1300267 RepID=A0A286DJP8_9ACTN|nr:hypothetical protein [Streptomyces zhaozhouensis]SOD58985.1 hypothetical protein SAMN06297387_101424 [Streptomyces zhaozhouensis]
MRGGGRGRALLPLLALLLTAGLTACGGSSDDGGAESARTASEESSGGGSGAAGGTAGDGAEPAEPREPGESDEPVDDGVPEETVPEEELVPSGGEFTEEQREFLVERVPTGVDPGAVLDQGTAACERLGYLSRHDPESVGEAVASGEIPEAEAAVRHLCPEYAEFVAPAD